MSVQVTIQRPTSISRRASAIVERHPSGRFEFAVILLQMAVLLGLRFVTDHFDVMPIGTNHEGGIVV